VSKSGAGDAEFIFLRLKSLGVDSLKVMSSRDLMVVWVDDVERLSGMLMFMDTSGTKSLEIRQ
jgi:hypothetical protein